MSFISINPLLSILPSHSAPPSSVMFNAECTITIPTLTVGTDGAYTETAAPTVENVPCLIETKGSHVGLDMEREAATRSATGYFPSRKMDGTVIVLRQEYRVTVGSRVFRVTGIDYDPNGGANIYVAQLEEEF